MPQKITQVSDPYKKRVGFGSIRTGDISRWAKGTARFLYPEPKNIKAKPVPVKSLNACVFQPKPERANTEGLVMVGSLEGRVRSTVGEGCDGMTSVEASLKISNKLDEITKSLVKKAL